MLEVARSYLGRGHDCCDEAAPGYDLDHKSWCQVFWLHCLREAGLTRRLWPSGPAWPTAWLPTTNHPEPGDMGYIDQPYQHGCVIESVSDDGQEITSIDGNSVGRIVLRNVRPRSKFDAFYSIAPLLDAPPDTQPVNPTPAVLLQRALTAAGYPCGKVDGVAGPKTQAALLAWALRNPQVIT